MAKKLTIFMFLFVTLSLTAIAALFAWVTSYATPDKTRKAQLENSQEIVRDSIRLEIIELKN